MDLTFAEIDYFTEISRSPASLDAKIDDEGDSELSSIVPDSTASSPLHALMASDLKEDMTNLMEALDPRESKIMKLRFGLEGGEGKTLEEIGNYFDISRERVRQIINKSIAALRAASKEQQLEFQDY